MAEIREGTYNPTDNTWWNRGAIINHYSNNYGCWGASCNAPDNNGNMMKQEVYIPNDDNISGYTTWWQQYSYDSLNRLEWAREINQSGSEIWRQAYAYDRYGNRTLNQGSTYGNGIPNPYFGVDQSTNRLTPAGGYTMHYDAAGNLDNDNYTGQGQRNFDAENKMTAAWSNGQWQSYVYDADGHRVKRLVGTPGETWQIYGIGGELIAEYAQNGAPASPQKEYGYRNGQVLITATVGSGGWGAAPTFQDNPLVVGQTTIRSAHITELRTAIDAVRSHSNLGNYPWAAPAAPGDPVSIAPIQEMRTALDQALGAGSYAGGLASGQPILKVHIQELRDRILSAWQSGGGGADIRWLVADQLGTPRMIFDQSGSLASTSRHDYLPFGEELFAGTGGRTQAQGYSASDGVRQHFSQKERDNETGLDYFLARYYSSTQGRFTSPDEFAGGPDELYEFEESASDNPTFYADTADPQSLNKYQYAYNNPLRFVDLDGHQGSETVKSALRDGAIGVGRGGMASLSWGLYPGSGPRSDDSTASRVGQVIGTTAVGLLGGVTAAPGGAVIVASGGEAAADPAISVPTAIGAIAVVGSVKNAIALATTPMQRNGSPQEEQSNKKQTGTHSEEHAQSKVPKSDSSRDIGGGRFTESRSVRPGRGPGQSRAEYVRIRNSQGRVIRTYKDTYDRANNFMHRKPLRGGPEGRPQQ